MKSMLFSRLPAGVVLFACIGLGCADQPLEEDAPTVVGPRYSIVRGAAETPAIDCQADTEDVVLGSGAAVTTVTLSLTTNIEPELADGSLKIAWFDTVQVPLGSQGSSADIPFELEYGEHQLVVAITTADGGLLANSESVCAVNVRVSRLCSQDADCDDSYFCNSNSCEPGAGGTLVCSFGPPPFAGCCVTDLDCPTSAVCDGGTHTCVQCLGDLDCDDQNTCTTDACIGGTCVSTKDDPDCCDCAAEPVAGFDEQCAGAGVCSTTTCDCNANNCIYTPVAEGDEGACCEDGDHASCNDTDPCTEDVCVANVCRNTVIVDPSVCCNEDSDCNDGNACTVDGCSVNTNTCVHDQGAGGGCCNTDLDCDDANETTWDKCIQWQCVYTDNFEFCVPPLVSEIVINELAINPAAVADADGEWIELHNRTESAIDLSGWELTSADAGSSSSILSPLAPLLIGAGGYLVLCRNGDSATNGGISCDAAYDAEYTLANNADSVVLRDGSGQLHDEVNYDGGPNFPNPVGASIALGNPQNNNDVGASWKASFAIIAGSTDKGTPGAQNVDVFGIFQMVECAEQPTNNVCTVDTCIDNTCIHIDAGDCCNEASDCLAPTPCHEPACVAHSCQFTVLQAPECCLADGECTDDQVCTVDKCIGNVCKNVPDPGQTGAACCKTDTDCGGVANGCVLLECDVATNICLPAQLIGGDGCCTANTHPAPALNDECDDGDPSTVDSCKDFACLSVPDADYCDAQPGEVGTNNCHLDGNPCTGDDCNLATSTCIFNALPDCCAAQSDCFDGNPCTADVCDLKTGQCGFEWIDGCCFGSQAGEHCDDGNSCTSDACENLVPLPGTPGEFYGQCRNLKTDPTCCNSNIECNDGNACSQDFCNLETNTCTHGQLALPGGQLCCDPKSKKVSVEQQCNDANQCTKASCVSNVCVQTPVPPSEFGACCDLQQPALGTEAEQCDDGTSCTLDKCLFGRCQNVVLPDTSCCFADADCDDGNSCTTDTCVESGTSTVCENTPVQCDDGLFCNGEETCLNGQGCVITPGSGPSLDDGIACTVGFCDEASDQVVHFPNDDLCLGGTFCAGDANCDVNAGCQYTGGPTPPDDGIECTIHVCDEESQGFLVDVNHALCDDGKECNGLEQCDHKDGCVAGEAPEALDDGIDCTVDSCDDQSNNTVHLPDSTLCDDGLVCTIDVCDVETGCLNTLQPGFCLINGVCYTPGTTDPNNGCQHCDPVVSTTSWSPKPAGEEVCDGQDNDCDGLTDEDLNGDPLVQPCTNACGDQGQETCTIGAFQNCSAPPVAEICDDNLDNDCDDQIDENCGKPGVSGAEIRFISTLGEPENLVVDKGDGTYTTWVQDLTNPNQSGLVRANAYGANSPNAAFDVTAVSPISVQVVSLRDTLYIDRADARFAVQLIDAKGRPPVTGTEVKVSFTGIGLSPGPGSQVICTTQSDGRCTVTWTAPEPAFDQAQVVQATVLAAGIAVPPIPLQLVKAPNAVAVPSKSVGLQLPASPTFPGEIFSVPVIINTGGVVAGAYDVYLGFNPVQLKAVAVQQGSCTGFTPPTSNLAADANTTGTLKLNSINPTEAACAIGSNVHVATVNFQVQPGLVPGDPTAKASVSVLCKFVGDVNLFELCQDAAGVVGDGNGTQGTGTVTAWKNEVKGILARAPDPQLLNYGPIDDKPQTTQLVVTAYTRDFSTVSVATDNATSFGATPGGIATVSPTGKVTPDSGAGNTTIAISHKGHVRTLPIRVLQPQSKLEFTDATLQLITGAKTPAGTTVRQRAGVRLKVEWTDGQSVQWEQDLTHRVTTLQQVTLPPGMAYAPSDNEITATVEGDFDVTVTTPLGFPIATETMAVSNQTQAVCTSLTVVAPCEVLMTGVNPGAPSVAAAKLEAEAKVSAYLNKYQQTCQANVYANFDDGSRMVVTGDLGITMASSAPTVLTANNGGLLTAQAAGVVDVSAKWTLDGQELCNGTTPVLVDLPGAIAITVDPSQAKLAKSSGDPAALLKGLPTSQQLTVTVHYTDGSSINFTNTAVCSDAAGDPANLISVNAQNLVASTGNGAGPAEVSCTVDLYPGLSGTSSIQVVEADGLAAEIYEPYTPVPPRVTDHVFSFIEGTTSRQDGTYEAVVTFSDGSSYDVTQSPVLQIAVYAPGTTNPQNGILGFDPATTRVTATNPGTVDLAFTFSGQSDIIPNFKVDSEKEGLALLTVDSPIATFTGVKDQGQLIVKVWGTFLDGTRRRFYDSRFVPGLLNFASTVAAAATINANGLSTIHANKSTVYTIDINPAVDVGTPFDPPTEYPVDCNLAPSCGDIDLGDTVGLAFKDRAPGQNFILEARINTCGFALGGFDITLSYDEAVLQVNEVVPKGATVGEIFTPNWLGVTGEILSNASFNPVGSAKKGNNLVLFDVHYTAKKGGSGVSTMAGTVYDALALDGVTEIGPATPRAVVAAKGDLDPDCSGPVPYDYDGNCTLNRADLLFVQRALTGQGTLPPGANILDAWRVLKALR